MYKIFKSDWSRGLLLFLLALLFYSQTYKHHMFTIYQGRDIRRMVELLQGSFVWYGPDLTGGGHTPGPFYYFLLAIPYFFFRTWESLIWFNIVLCSAAAAVFWYAGKKMFSDFGGTLFFFLFLNSQFFREQLSYFWNPSFLFIFQAILLVLIPHASKKLIALIACAILLGLTVQIHYIQIAFVVYLLLALTLAPQSRLEKTKKVATGILFFFIPLLPYLVWTFFYRQNLAAHSVSGGADILFQPLAAFFQFPNGEGLLKLINNAVNFFTVSLVSEKGMLLLVPLWIFALSKKDLRKVIFANKSLWLAMGFSCIVSISVIYGQFTRYFVPIFIFGYFLSVPILEWFIDKYLGAHARSIALIALFAFTLANFALILKNPPISETNLREREQLIRRIIQKTNWDYQYFREHAFIVGFEPESEYEVIYNQALRDGNRSSAEIRADGVLAIRKNFGKILKDHGTKEDWIAARGIPKEFIYDASDGQLSCTFTEEFNNFEICYYKYNSAALARNNIGYSYVYEQPAVVPIRENEFVQRIDATRWLFYKNICENHEPACTLYFLLTSTPGKSLEIKVFGDPISAPNPAPTPAWAATFKNGEVEIYCGQKKDVRRIALMLGINRFPDGSYDYGFLAPYSARFPLRCKSPTQLAVKLGKEGSSFVNVLNRLEVQSYRLAWSDTE